MVRGAYPTRLPGYPATRLPGYPATRLLARLHQTLGEQKIDLMIEPDASHPLARIAVKTGVRL